MNDKINELLERVEAFKPKAAAEIEDFRIRMLGKKGELTALMEEFKSVAPELKREFGQKLNNLKNRTQERINALRGQLADAAGDSSQRIPDMSRPGSAEELGSRHPISLVTNQIVEVSSRLGYTVAEGPEIEDDWHVFSALNFPPEHPARDMQDTFFIAKNPDVLLRTHTSSIQVRTMERQKPPIRVICPGRVFRNEAISYRAHCIFHQIEGLYIDEGVSFADLKQSILYFAKEVFGENATIRMRPRTFPSPNRRPRSMCRATSAAARAATSARARVGWRSWAAAWSIPMCLRPMESIRRNIPGSRSAWGSSVSPCSNTA